MKSETVSLIWKKRGEKMKIYVLFVSLIVGLCMIEIESVDSVDGVDELVESLKRLKVRTDARTSFRKYMFSQNLNAKPYVQTEDVKRVLKEAGISLEHIGTEEGESEKHYETHLANQCKTVLMRSANLGSPLGDLEGSDLEERLKNGEDIMSMIEIESKVNLGDQDSGSDPESIAALDCECDTYKCQCRKMCFCQLQEAQFGGNIVPAPSEDQAPDGANIVDSQFKCTCDFESAPGTGALAGGTIDCDCKIADCACEKQCKCKMKSK